MEVLYLDIDLVQTMCHPYAVAHFDNEEDRIPPFKDYNISLLDSALNSPKHTFGGNDLYSTLGEKSAILFYTMIQNHPFKNGNKRIATAALLVFLYMNNHWLEVGQEELAAWALKIATSGQQNPPLKKEVIVPELTQWISSHTRALTLEDKIQ